MVSVLPPVTLSVAGAAFSQSASLALSSGPISSAWRSTSRTRSGPSRLVTVNENFPSSPGASLYDVGGVGVMVYGLVIVASFQFGLAGRLSVPAEKRDPL